MVKDFKPSVSVEEMAAYLDGNLNREEFERIRSIISYDSQIAEIYDEVSNDDTTQVIFSDMPKDVDFWDDICIPVVDGLDNFHLLDDDTSDLLFGNSNDVVDIDEPTLENLLNNPQDKLDRDFIPSNETDISFDSVDVSESPSLDNGENSLDTMNLEL